MLLLSFLKSLDEPQSAVLFDIWQVPIYIAFEYESFFYVEVLCYFEVYKEFL